MVKGKEGKMGLKGDTEDVNNRPLLVEEDCDGNGRESEWWCNKILDLGEAKNQILFSLPMIITSVSYHLIPLTSVMFASHLGELELAATNIANSWAIVTGFAFMIGLSGALETLCGQGYGAKTYRMLGIYLQASCIISVLFYILLSIFWWFSVSILIFLHQDLQIAKAAGLYLRFLIPGLFAYGVLQNLLRFLQTQSVVIPLVVCSVFPVLQCWNYIFFHSLDIFSFHWLYAPPILPLVVCSPPFL